MERPSAGHGPGRRDVLAASGLGISSLALPAASAAASILSYDFAPSAQVTYVSGDAPIVSWTPFAIHSQIADPVNAPTVFTPRASDYRLETLVTSAAQQPNPTHFAGANSNPTDGQISYTEFSSKTTTTDWTVRNPSNLFDADDTPYVEYALTVAAGRTAQVRSLVMHSFRIGSARDVGLAFYRSTDGFVTPQLRRTVRLSTQDYVRIVVDLGGITVTGGTALAVRMYVFGTDGTNDLFVRARNESGITPTPRNGLTVDDSAQSTFEDPSVAPTSLPAATVSFIGQDVTLPT